MLLFGKVRIVGLKLVLDETLFLVVIGEKLTFRLTFTPSVLCGTGGMFVTSLHKSFALQQYIDESNIGFFNVTKSKDAFHSDVLCIEDEL